MAQGPPRKSSQDKTEHAADGMNEQQINAEFAKAFQELARGEQTAANLESRLSDIESKIDQLLASAEEAARQAVGTRSDSDGPNTSDAKPQSK